MNDVTAAIRLYVTHARKFPSSRFQFQIALLEAEDVTCHCVLTTSSQDIQNSGASFSGLSQILCLASRLNFLNLAIHAL